MLPAVARTRRRTGTLRSRPTLAIGELRREDRDSAIPILKESFTGYYRWHAKRILREAPIARGATASGALVGVALLEPLTPEVGYVYYIFVGKATRRVGVAAALLEDALAEFARRRARIVYAVVGARNQASRALFRRFGFRIVRRKEVTWKEGGLGAWGLRSRMHIVSGEVVLGRLVGGPLGLKPRRPVRGGPPAVRGEVADREARELA